MKTTKIELISSNRKQIIIFNCLWIVLIGGIMFPINLVSDFLLMIPILVFYFFVAYLFFVLFEKRSLVLFPLTFILNLIGLSCRFLLEWGEYPITSDFTILNVSIHLISFPLYITIINLLFYRSKTREK